MNTEENKSEPVPELTPEMQKIVAAAVAQAMAQQQPQAAGSNVNPPAEKTTSPAPSADFSEPKGTPGEWGMWLALRSCLTRYADFAGRASRSEFWYTVLANFLVLKALELLVVLGVFLAVCTGTPGVVVAVICGLLLLSYNILMMVPGLSVTVRRMHDTGRSGWAICFYFIPLAGPIIFLLFALGESGEANQYGKAPNHPVSDDEKAPAIVAWVIKTCRTLFVDNIGKTMVYAGGGVAAIAAVWTGLHFLLAPANPLKPLYEEGLLNEKSLGFGAAGKLNSAYQKYLEGDMEITDYPFVPELLKVAHDKEFSLSVEVVQALVEAGADINAVSGSDTVWAHAFELGDPAILQYLVSAGVQKQDTYSTFSGEKCFMHQAVATDKPEMLRAMAAVGCNVDFRRSDDDVTALMIAINQEKPEMIKLLAELKADFNAYFMNGEQKVTVFEVAADKSPEMLALVEELGALPTGEIAAARLFEIADKGDLDAFNAMKAKGVDMVSLSKMTNKHGSTPLMIAANFASADFVKAMIDAGVDVNAKGNTGDTPLIYGAKRPDIVKALLEAGADVNAVNNEGKSALTHAVGSNAEDSIRLLAQAGADIKAAVQDVYSYLTYAAKNNKCKSIRALIELGADVNAADASGKTPLYRAVMADNAEAIKTLVELGANLQERNVKTHTLLHIAAGYNNAAALKQLLACPGADVNVTMLENTVTPLHIAASNGSAECVKVLLETPGVNVNATARYGDAINFTALHWAATDGHEEVIKLLLADPRTDINARCYNKKDRKYYHSITLLAKEGRDACLKLFLDTRAVPADDVKEASKAAVFQGTQKTVELLMWYTPDPEKVNAAARVASGQAASTTSSTKTAVSTENAVDSTDRTTEPSAHQPSSYGDAPVMLQGKLLVMDYSSAEHATVETDGETEQVAQYEVVPAGTYGTDGKQTLKPYSEDEYAITLGAYERKGADSAELAVLSFAAEPTKPLLEKLGDYIYLMPHRRLSSMFAMYGGDGMDTYYLQFTSPTGGTAKRVIEASCEATYVRNIRFTIESDPTAESAEAVFGSVAAPATLDGVWMKLSHVGGVVWFYCTEGKIYRCNDEIGDSNAAPEKPSRFKDVSQGSGYMFKDNLGRPYSAAHEFSYTPKGNTAELFMRVLTIKRTFLACFDAEKDYANDIVTYDGKPMKITFTSNNNGVLRGYCEGVWGMEEFGDPSQTYGLTIYTDGITAAPTVAAPVADNGMEELESFITALKDMNPKGSTQKLYCKRLLTLLPEIARGGDVNLTLKETKGNTALHYACGMGHVELVTWLVQHGADVTKRTDRGKTPMECAGGNVEAIRAALGL